MPSLTRHPTREALAAAHFRGEGVKLGLTKGRFSEVTFPTRRVLRLCGIPWWNDDHSATDYFEASQRPVEAGRDRSFILGMSFPERVGRRRISNFTPK